MKTPHTPVAQQRVDHALRSWRDAAVPPENPSLIGDRRARTLTVIGAAMREGRLERERFRGRRRWGVMLAAAAALLGVAGASYKLVTGHHLASVPALASGGSLAQVATGAVVTGRAGQVWAGSASVGELLKHEPLEQGSERALSIGERVVTEAGSSARLKVGGDTELEVRAQSELLLARNDAGERRLALQHGSVEVAVEPALTGSARRRVVVQTPDVSVVVHGTRFSVAVSGDPGTSVTHVGVQRGVVAVLRSGVEVARLTAGQTWSSPHQPPASHPSPAPPEVSDSSVKASAVVASAAGESEVRSRRSAAAAARTVRSGRALSAESPATRVDASEAEVASSTLAQENRLFQQAVDARNRGDDARAVRSFDQLLAQYPRSALAQEAQVERFRALKRLGRDRDAAREARRYLIEHGNGFAEDEARDIALTPGH